MYPLINLFLPLRLSCSSPTGVVALSVLIYVSRPSSFCWRTSPWRKVVQAGLHSVRQSSFCPTDRRPWNLWSSLIFTATSGRSHHWFVRWQIGMTLLMLKPYSSLLHQVTRLIQEAASTEVGLWSGTLLCWKTGNCGAYIPGHNQATKSWEAVTAAIKSWGVPYDNPRTIHHQFEKLKSKYVAKRAKEEAKSGIEDFGDDDNDPFNQLD